MAAFRIDAITTREQPLHLEVQGEVTNGVIARGMSLVVPLAPDADVATILSVAAIRHIDGAGPDDRRLVLLVPMSPLEAAGWPDLLRAGMTVHAAHLDPAA